MRRQFPLGKQLLFSLIILCGILLLGETAVRAWANYFRTPYERYNSATTRLELVPNLTYTTGDGLKAQINSRGFLGPEFDQRPADGVYRIIAVGDSCTFSGGVSRLAYPGMLEHSLNTAAGRKRFEVINGGIEGYNSTFARQRIEEELIDYRPNLIVLYIGWNDLMKVDPRNVRAVGQYAALANVMEQSYLLRAYRKLMFVYLRPLVFQPKVTIDDTDSRAYDTFVPTTYQENLQSIVGTLRRHGIESMLVTLPTVVRPGMTREELEKANVFFPYFAGTYSLGEFLSLHRAYNRTVQAVGAALDVPVVDLDETFNRRDKSQLFWDTMHPSRTGHCLIARALHGRIGTAIGLPSEPLSDEKICR